MLTEKDVIAEPEVATIMQNAGKNAKEKFAHSSMVEQQSAKQSVSEYTRNTETMRVESVENTDDISLLFI